MSGVSQTVLLDNATLTTVKFKIFKSSCIQEFPDSSTGNHIQYSGINHNGKKYLKREYIRVKLHHFAVQQRFTKHCKSPILQFEKEIPLT